MTGASARLILSRAPADFDPARDRAIGPWCFVGVEDAHPGWERLPFHDAYREDDELAQDSRRISALAEALCRERCDTMNQRHGTDYSYAYWRIHLLPWILLLLQAFWKRYRHVETFVRHHGREPLVATLPEAPRSWAVRDVLDLHLRLLSQDAFNTWMTARFLVLLRPEAWQLVSPIPSSSSNHGTAQPEAPKPLTAADKFRNLLRSLLYDQRCRRVYGIRWTSFLFSAYLTLLPKKRIPPGLFPQVDPSQARAALPPLFVEFVDSTLFAFEPATLGNDFQRYHEDAARRTVRPGKINLIGPLLTFNEAEKFLLARAVENGELIYCTQHGGSGFQSVNINSVQIEKVQHAYLTWGWTAQSDFVGRFVSLPSPMMSPYRDRHKRRSDSLLLVGTSARVHANRLESAPQPSQTIGYRQAKYRLVDALSGACRSRLVYRPHFEVEGVLSDGPDFARRYPDIEILRGNIDRLHRLLMRCSLQIVDHPGTTFVMGLVANVPTVAFWSTNTYGIVEQARPIFEDLADAKMFFDDDPTAAALHVNAVIADAPGWWASEAVQSARRRFLTAYARTSPVWWWHWAKALWTFDPV